MGRSWQVRRAGELLGAACGVEVRLHRVGRAHAGPWGDWVVHWHDGPTEGQMRRAARRLLPGGGPRADELGYSRSLSTQAEAAALLLWLADHPSALRAVGAVHLVAARDDVPYPERADEPTRSRADALLLHGGGRLGYEVLSELAGRARGGWPAVTRWLDTPAAPVVDLAAERVRRRRGTTP